MRGISADEAKIRLVNEGGGVERFTGSLFGHACGREFPQLVMDEREQLRGGLGVAGRSRVTSGIPFRAYQRRNDSTSIVQFEATQTMQWKWIRYPLRINSVQ